MTFKVFEWSRGPAWGAGGQRLINCSSPALWGTDRGARCASLSCVCSFFSLEARRRLSKLFITSLVVASAKCWQILSPLSWTLSLSLTLKVRRIWFRNTKTALLLCNRRGRKQVQRAEKKQAVKRFISYPPAINLLMHWMVYIYCGHTHCYALIGWYPVGALVGLACFSHIVVCCSGIVLHGIFRVLFLLTVKNLLHVMLLTFPSGPVLAC